jgi:hypothetical protein
MDFSLGYIVTRVVNVTGKFDLNIEKILENWEPYHAVREIIANAMDEALLTDSSEIEIYKDENGNWLIRDFGRGLRYTHLTQNENDEKLHHPHVIGKFGIGLKDALATLERHGIGVLIKSRFGDIRLVRSEKEGFDDIVTLHAKIEPPSEPDMRGTKFILSGISDEQVDLAKRLFLRFSGERVIERTKYGDIVEKRGTASIYVNGVKVADEENFLFSYNITALNASIKKALNRERTNVGRSAYALRIKSILLASNSVEVAQALADDLQNYSFGTHHDELGWLAVQEHAVKILNRNHKVLFASSEEVIERPDIVDEVKESGFEIVTLPENLKTKIEGTEDIDGNPVNDLSHFMQVRNESFSYDFVDIASLSLDERRIYDLTDAIFELFGGKPDVVESVKISETMQEAFYSGQATVGVWDASSRSIIIKRTQLGNLADYAGTLLHEAVHAKSGYGDVSRGFESELTRVIGIVSEKALKALKREEQKPPSLWRRLFHLR